MVIYGTSLLALCLLAGLMAGKALGWLLGIPANVGGVGIAMLLLIWSSDRIRRSSAHHAAFESGITFWSAIYIPVTVAMAASQNVRAALSGGTAAILAGLLSVIACLALVPLVSRIGRDESTRPE